MRRSFDRRGFIAAAGAAGLAAALPAPLRAARPPLEIVGQLFSYAVRGEETLLDVARNFELGYLDIVAANPGVDPWQPGAGRDLLLPTAHILPQASRRGIVINIPELRLYYFAKSGVHTFPLGVGRDGLETPLGRTSVVRKKKDPEWRPTPRMRKEDPELPAVVPAGPDNPLGEYALYLGFPAYLIHGTHKPWGIGRRVSSGCIRLYPEGIERLYHMVPRGTPVTIVDQPVKVGWLGTELFLEAHFTKKQADEMEADGAFTAADAPGVEALIKRVALDDADRVDWGLVSSLVQERAGVPTQITRPAGYVAAKRRAPQPSPRPRVAATPEDHLRTLEADLSARSGGPLDDAAAAAPAARAPRRLSPVRPGG